MKNLIKKILREEVNEQLGGILASRLPSAVRSANRINLSKSTGKAARLGFPEDNPVGDIPCELEPIERIQELFNSSKKFIKNSSDDKFAQEIVPKIVSELSGVGSGNVLNLIKLINTEGKLKAVIDNFDKNKSKYSNESFYEWIENEIMLNKTDIVNILSKSFTLPYCRKGCDCPVS